MMLNRIFVFVVQIYYMISDICIFFHCCTCLFPLNMSVPRFSCSIMSDSATPWTAAHQATLSIKNSRSLLKLMSIKSVMTSSHLILCHPLLLQSSIFPASGSFPMSQFLTSGGQSIGVSVSVRSVQLLSCVRPFVTPWTAASQASPSITNSWSLLKLMSIVQNMTKEKSHCSPTREAHP